MTCCSTCGGVLRNGASFCAVCGTPTAVPAKVRRTKQGFLDAGNDFARLILIACIVVVSIPVVMLLGCLALL